MPRPFSLPSLPIRIISRTCAAAILLGAFAASPIHAGDWPQWRGPTGMGLCEEKNVPLEWSAKDNVKWKVKLPEAGNSSPIVIGNKVLLTCPINKGHERMLMCLNRTNGEELWHRSVEYEANEATHGTNPQCSASPVTDGERVVVFYGSAGLHCYDLAGQEQWKKDLGKFDHIWGYGTSPVIVGDLVILNAGPGTHAFVAAFNKKTGDEVWRKEFPDMKSEKPEEFRGSWSTPVLIGQGDNALLLLSLPNKLRAVKPQTGEEVWSCGGLSKLVYTSPLVDGDVVVSMSGYHGPAIACKLGGHGDVTESHRLWHHTQKNPQRIGSGVAVGGHVYIMNENGVVWCLDEKTGEMNWESRVGGSSWGSMIHVDGRLYVQDKQSNVAVIAVDPKECRVLAKNEIKEGSNSSPAFSNGNVFIRTFQNLYCIEASK